ncbi:YhcN/YlaJ family sporulation lipoprotein [Sutcliffiella halmapala]|uniref:YhcN/YlaJ family sporulation lipoprotein n=1 Tax=Sutcliffiella halmapala TaxID=79882 RepID=UPI000994DB76|nr:YhcN/YlaJ family sporulation lipoprotein [Sutcliffiella halmapala]
MRKSVLTVTSAAFLLGGLAGCGTGDRAADNRYYEETRPIGYYTSENNPYVNHDRNRQVSNDRRSAYRLNDNDGPLNEIMDRAVIYGERNNHNNARNRTAPLPTGNRGGMFGDRDRAPNFSRKDINYHGQLNGLERTADPSYYNNYQGRLTEQLADRASKVKGVEDVRAVAYGNDILVAVEPQNGASEQKVRQDVRRAVQPLVNGKDCRVVVDQGAFTTVLGVDNDLRDGGPVDDINNKIRDLINTTLPNR